EGTGRSLFLVVRGTDGDGVQFEEDRRARLVCLGRAGAVTPSASRRRLAYQWLFRFAGQYRYRDGAFVLVPLTLEPRSHRPIERFLASGALMLTRGGTCDFLASSAKAFSGSAGWFAAWPGL